MKYSSKIYRRFRHGHKFFRYLLLDRILNKKDNFVLITGKRGSGKTTLGIKLIMGFTDIKSNEEYYNEEKNALLGDSEKVEYSFNDFTPFNMEKHICFSKKELQTLWKEETMAFILADEAIVNANRRNAMTKDNKILTEIITINRKNYNTVIFCMPSVEDFDLSILQYVSHWIHIDDRGLGAVLLPNPPSLFGRKSWDIDKMKKIYEKFLDSNLSMSSVPYWLFDNFRGYINFKALTAGVERKYNEIATLKKNADSDELELENVPKSRRGSLNDEQKEKVEEIVNKMINGDICESKDYYKESSGLDMTKDKFNKEINKKLFELGDGRNFTRVLKENKESLKYKILEKGEDIL